MPPTPPLLEGIGRVLVATENERKLAAVRGLLDRYPIIRGTDVLMPEPHRLSGDEPPWENAVAVSRNKVENVVDQLQGAFGPKTLVVASDIVIWYNQRPYQNLSRLPHLTEAQLNEEVRHLQDIFSEETEVIWDVATSVSRPEVQASLADRHIARFRPIDPERIATAFYDDIPGAKQRNSRIQLLENFANHVLTIETIPFVEIADQEGNVREGCEWMNGKGAGTADRGQYLREVLAQVVGGLPVNGRLEALLRVRPLPCNKGKWLLV